MGAVEVIDAWIDPCGSDTGRGIIDALKAAGFVVVELPKPDAGNAWVVDDDDFAVQTMPLRQISDGNVVNGVQIAWGSLEMNLCVKDAHNLAAALLAAADRAEAGK